MGPTLFELPPELYLHEKTRRVPQIDRIPFKTSDYTLYVKF